MLGFIFIGVGIVIIVDAADVTLWELTFGIGFILFGIAGLLGS